ncbi:hypothetical protein niasHT_006388 [Heterodera trifolii]|uniref:Integrase catalytic domain-containing protein n=1 Tax=Heterodera trifolii TaxID=157864 RepID=A0ABD2M442_9BILA
MWLITVDAKTKWPEVAMMKSTTTEATIEAIRKLIWTHGLPEQIVSDNGPQFASKEFEEFCSKRGIERTLTAPYHPQSNGEAERFVQPNIQERNVVESCEHYSTSCAHPTRPKLKQEKEEKVKANAEKHGQKYLARAKKNFDRRTWKRSFKTGQRVFARNYRDGCPSLFLVRTAGQPTNVDEQPNDPQTLDNPPLRRSSRERRPRQIFDPSK